ncbi:MAG: hypothetical protein Q8N23_28675 [Archangium sp.]|nr:hypothetical protein [Archangium sp.]MDP3570622.1 hypothetical protein [Archangium sp.]
MKTLGIPRMHKEAGERRDFLPPLLAAAAAHGVEVVMERGVGSGMGLTEADYRAAVPGLRVVDTRAEAWAQDVVLVLRSPEAEEFPTLIKPGSTVVAMLHLPTRPRRVAALRALGAFAVSLDGLADDEGARLVENTRAVGWNGLEAAFSALEQFNPWRLEPQRGVINVTVMGAGQVGKHAAEAAIKYGSRERWEAWSARGTPPVTASVVGRRIVADPQWLADRLELTDVLVDATQRDRSDVELIPNTALHRLPAHAVVCDLNVDPYVPSGKPPTVRGIEGIPMGSLDQFIFAPDDAQWMRTVPAEVPHGARRAVVSCYSWPGLHPRPCMEHYGRQLEPLLVRLLERGGAGALPRDGDALDRALWRAGLSALAA